MLRTPLLPLFTLALILISCGGGAATKPTPTAAGGLPLVTIRIGDTPVQAEVARTAAQQELGLGERDSLPANHGMLFVFPRPDRYQFWMKGMRFALDFIWVGDDSTVREVTADVAPQPGVPDNQLSLYQPQQAVRYVLEVNAGFAASAGIKPGAPVDLSALRTQPAP